VSTVYQVHITTGIPCTLQKTCIEISNIVVLVKGDIFACT
jgi:hypothetical protein